VQLLPVTTHRLVPLRSMTGQLPRSSASLSLTTQLKFGGAPGTRAWADASERPVNLKQTTANIISIIVRNGESSLFPPPKMRLPNNRDGLEAFVLLQPVA
jgi:hypothetical protein